MGADDVSRSKARKAEAARTRENFAGKNVWVASFESHVPTPSGPQGFDLETVVQWASNRNDGWLRIVPDASGEVHWKWRFTSGRWKGHYVYWLQNKYEGASAAWEGLARKLDLVDQGDLKPSRDVY